MSNKIQQHSLVVGCSAAPSLLQFPCDTGYRVKSGTQGPPFAFGGLQEGPYWCPVLGRGATADSLFVKVGETSLNWPAAAGGAIEAFDVATGFFKSVAAWATGPRNFLVDGEGALVTWDVSGTKIVKYPPTGALPFDFITGGHNPGLFNLGNTGPMQWSPSGDLCLLLWAESYDGDQFIGRFDGSSGAYLGELVSGSQLVSWTETWGEPYEWLDFMDFAFAPDGTIYCTDTNRVVRLDGRTGDFIDVFIRPEVFGWPPSPWYEGEPFSQGWYVGDLLVSPDGEFLYVTVSANSYNSVFVFAVATGARTGTIPIGPRSSSRKTFITQEVTGNVFPGNYKPEYPLPHIVFLTKILTGVAADSAGVVANGQGAQSSAYWSRVALRVWNALGAEEREAVVAFGMLQLSTLLAEKGAGAEMKVIFERHLSAKIYNRLQALLRDSGPKEQREEPENK